MELLHNLIDIFVNLDEHLTAVIIRFGGWTYLILFLVIFAETGLVVTPFLPGDSLLFAVGAIAAGGVLRIEWIIVLLLAAAILGDSVNYAIGQYVGPRVFTDQVRFLKKEHLEKTQAFYEKHGGKTIILARFIPIIRTFAPFVAGVGAMSYSRFFMFNVVGALIWVPLFSLAGYFFGNLPFVQHNFELVILAIIFLSVLPAVYEFFKERRAQRAQPTETA
ncbi:MAG TPA: DedA family protein [Anaerolineales bacterium]|nr:DedA family protein [Anaerolineales bacterium]